MLNLTVQERRVLLFLLGFALSGIGVSFVIKAKAGTERFIKIAEADVRVDINRAGYEDLLRTKRVTAGLARNIIEYRKEHGFFRDIEEIKKVKGIGKRRFEKLKELFFVE